MDILKFVDFHVKNKSIDVIKYGLESSFFNSKIKFNLLCSQIIND